MTCIAWDGRSLAGDRQGNYGGTKVAVRKVFKVRAKDGRTLLVGYTGDSADCAAHLEWLRGKGERPVIRPESGFTALVVDEQLRLWRVEWNLLMQRVYDPIHAVGCGRGEALGAMAMGADARKAVQVASRFDSAVGMGVHVVRFGRG